MKLTLAVDTSEGRRRLELLTDRLQDLTPVLREFDKYKRERVQAIFDAQGPGWEPRADGQQGGAALAARETKIREGALEELRSALRSNVKRASKRVRTGKGKVSAKIRADLVLAQFDDMIKSGAIDFDALAGRTRNGTVDQRFFTLKTGRAVARYRGAAEAAKNLLGKIPQSIVSKVEKGLLTIESTIPWAGVQNEGGTVGNNAELPARPFLFWDDVDLGFLVILLREAGLLAMGG